MATLLMVPAMFAAWVLLAVIAALCAVIPALDRMLATPRSEWETDEWNAW